MYYAGQIFTPASLLFSILLLVTIWVVLPLLAIFLTFKFIIYALKHRGKSSIITRVRLLGVLLIAISGTLYISTRNQSAAMPLVFSLSLGSLGCFIILFTFAITKKTA